MILTIAVMIVATVAICTFLLAPRLEEERILFGKEPDFPCAFGYRMSWLAIKSNDTRAVAEALGIEEAAPCNWNSGIGAVYDAKLGENHVFVSPPVRGWTFVVGMALPYPAGQNFIDKVTPLLVGLGGRFSDVQYFLAFPPLDLFSWARVADGRLVRAFAAGDEGIIWSKGKTTREERQLGLKLFELRGVNGRRGDAGGELILHPTEEHVMRIAQSWSLDPAKLSPGSALPGLGYIALAPASWRARRVRKAAA